jgi:two-component system nitrogen regulation sensor histidine kinase GlnL
VARDLQGVLDGVLAGMVVLDALGHVELLNAAACRMLETSAQAAAGQGSERLFGPGHPIARLARGVLESGRAVAAGELELERRAEPALEVDVSAAPLFDADGAQDGVILVLRDRTLQRRLEELASQREQLAAFGRIAAGIAHEVRNPLGGIRGAAEILGARAGDPKSRDAASLVVREVDRIAALVDELMVFSRGDDLCLAPLNVHRVLDDVLELAVLDPLGAQVEVRRDYDPSIPELEGDAPRLTQVFLNLVRNALQAMEGGGRLTIETRMPVDLRLGEASGAQLPTVVVSIADTGPGIALELQEHLATPFFTTRTGGTGLGLAVARHWVASHGGALRIESQPGAGTRVRVALPLRRRAP